MATLLSTALASDVALGRALTVVLMTSTLLLTFLRPGCGRRTAAASSAIVVGIATVLAVVSTAGGIDGAGNQLIASLIAAGFVVARSRSRSCAASAASRRSP